MPSLAITPVKNLFISVSCNLGVLKDKALIEMGMTQVNFLNLQKEYYGTEKCKKY